MDYKDTINLPRTPFAMKANLANREPGMVEEWEAADRYQRIQEKTAGRPLWVLHDGPPYANGDLHMGHAVKRQAFARPNHVGHACGSELSGFVGRP